MRRKGAKGTAANKLNMMLFHLKKVTDSDNHLISLVILTGVAGRLVKSDREAKWLEAAKVTEVEVRIRFLRFSRFPKQDQVLKYQLQVMRLADFITGTVAKRRWMGLKYAALILISALKDTPGCGWKAPSSSCHETGC